ANCREYLEGQLSTINPEYIVCWGAVAARNLLKSPLSIGRLRGKFHEYGRAKVLCTYHPSYLLRNPAAKKDVWQDMQFLMSDMGVDLKGKAWRHAAQASEPWVFPHGGTRQNSRAMPDPINPNRRDWLAVIFALVLPTLITVVYFILLA